MKKAHLHAISLADQLFVTASFCNSNITDASLYIEASKFSFSCLFELWKQAMTFVIEQGCLFLCFCIFFLVKYNFVNFNDNQKVYVR